MIAFEVRGGYEAARGLLGSVELITPAVSLGSVDTLIQHPAGLTHRIVSEEAQQQSGIGPGLIRLSVGLEDVEDLWSDLSNALYQSDYQLAMTAK
jgi:cystathionine beta-lyase/cystathionine gamma-synthase